MSIHRREFLKAAALMAAGSQFGIPGLSTANAANVAGLGTAKGSGPKRFIFLRFCNGLGPESLTLPTFSEKDKEREKNKETLELDLDKHELQPWMQVLAPYKKNMTILQGMSALMNTNGHGGYQSVMGCFKCDGRISMIKRATVDFELAKLFPSPYGHIELALRGSGQEYSSGILEGFAAPSPFQKNYCYADPETAVNELFKSVTDPLAAERDNKRLAFLKEQEARRVAGLSGFEQLKISNMVDSLDAIHARNKLVAQKADLIKKYMPDISKLQSGGADNATSPEMMDAMTEVLISALATGLTNVVLYRIDDLSTPMRGVPGNEADRVGLHALGHGVGYSGVSAGDIKEQIRILHIKQIEKIIAKLKRIPEGNGTMFDNTMIMYFPENGEKHHGTGIESPWMVLAGDNCRLDIAGRYFRLPSHGVAGHKTLSNWYTTLLNAHGNPIEHYGDLDLGMSRLKLAQTGAIKQFMPKNS